MKTTSLKIKKYNSNKEILDMIKTNIVDHRKKIMRRNVRGIVSKGRFNEDFGGEVMYATATASASADTSLESFALNGSEDLTRGFNPQVFSNGISDVAEINNQEEGVNEGFRFQHNGKNLCYLKNDNELHITSFSKILEHYFTDFKSISDLNEYFIKNDFKLKDKDFTKLVLPINIKEFHLVGNQLIVVCNEKNTQSYYGYNNIKNSLNKVMVYDVLDNLETKLTKTLELEGNIKFSSITNGKLYIMNEFIPSNQKDTSRTVTLGGSRSLKSKSNENSSKKENLFPKLDNNYGLLDYKNFFLIDEKDTFKGDFRINTILSLDLSKLKVDSYSFAGTFDINYMNGEYLTLASTIQNGMTKDTIIHSFDLRKKIKYQGNILVEGELLNKFSMSIQGKVLRLASTIKSFRNVQNFVYTVKLSNKKLKVLDSVTDFGKPNETIEGIRFYGDIAYVVTFHKTDPLYTFDLSNPKKIELLGELEIPGYSIYFQQISKNRIVSLGKDATDTGFETGVMLQLFDVKDKTNVKLIDKVKYGNNWHTTTDVFQDQKNLLYRQSDNLFGFSINEGYWNNQVKHFNLVKFESNKINKLLDLDLEVNDFYNTVLTYNDTDYLIVFVNDRLKVFEV